jgi:hypothetical protein
LIYDDLKTSGPPARFDWLLHVNDRDRLQANGAGYVYQGAKGAMYVRPLYPEQAKIQVENGHFPYAVFYLSAPPEAPAQPGILSIHSGAPSSDGRFLVALNLVRPAQPAARRNAQIEKIEGHGCLGARLGHPLLSFATAP